MPACPSDRGSLYSRQVILYVNDMLHDPSHITPLEVAEEVRLEQFEIDILKTLAEEWATKLPVLKEKARQWQELNDLESECPMVWINEIPWHEMNYNDELTLRCKNNWGRSQEDLMRKTVYQWRHMPGDMILKPWLDCPFSIHSTDFGIIEDVDLAITDSLNGISTVNYDPQRLWEWEIICMEEFVNSK